MIFHWTLFALIFIGIPFFVIYTRNMVYKTANIELTSMVKEQTDYRAFIYMIHLWFIDLFYMACFLNNMVCKYIFGGFIMLTIFMNLAGALSQPKKRNSIELWSMLIDFIIGIGLTIYLIFIIPNVELKEIVTPIIASVYCGLLTLLGVTLTIRKSDYDRKEEEIKKARPFIFFVDVISAKTDENKTYYRSLLSERNKGTLKAADKEENAYSISQIWVYNADYSYASIWGFKINNDIHLYDIGQVIKKDSIFVLKDSYRFLFNEEIKYVALILKDMLDNYYELETEFEIIEEEKTKKIHMISGVELKKYNTQS